jgi:hypothetical protein
VIFDTLSFSGHYRKMGWQQLTNQARATAAPDDISYVVPDCDDINRK